MEKILNKLLKVPYLVLGLILLITVLFIFPMKENTKMETNLDKYMPENHPAFVYSNKAEEWFNIKDGIIIAIENKKGVYNSETLEIVKKLTKKIQKFKDINKADVVSLYTADNIVGTDAGMDVKVFYKRIPKTKEQLAELKKKVESNEMVFGRIVSKDETVTVIIAGIDNDVFSQDFYKNILKVSKEFETKDNKIYVAGRPIVEGTMALLGPKDMKKMVPIVILVIMLVLYLTLRSVKSTIMTLLVVFFSTIWAFGLMALVNIPIYAVSTMIPVMLIAIGVADGIHLYSHLHLYMRKHPETTKLEAVKDMLKNMWSPVVMTSVTTAVGFISLLTSQVYPIKYFGIFTAFGVMVAMVFSLVLIPAGIMAFGLPKFKEKKKKDNDKQSDDFAYGVAEKVLKHKYATIFITIIIVAVSIAGMTKVWINSSFLDKFEKTSDIVQTDKFINEHFGGTSTLNVILDSKESEAFKNPKVLKLVEKMQRDVVGNLKIVGNSFSLADYLERMNKVMHADKEKYNTIPNNRNLIAQYLLLYEMSGDPDNLWKVVTEDYNKVNITFQLKSDNSKAINAALARIEKFRDDFNKLGVTINYAGSGYKALVFTDLILQGQIISLVMSLFIVIILLSLMFKNIKLGLIGSVPIMITAVISFGIMGWFGIPLNSTTALLSSIAIGIGIDYAVHLIEQYKINSACGDKDLTVKKTMAHSGRAILFNAIVVIAGFLVLLFSVFPPNRELGFLVSLNMFISFVGTLTIMVILLYQSNIYFKNKIKGN
jgi:predicted RND superfamily exporter protein